MEAVLLACGLAATAIGTWRGYVNARAIVGPLVHPGDATPTVVTPTTPTTPAAEQARGRQAARNLVAAIAWLVIALYGLFLIASAEAPA